MTRVECWREWGKERYVVPFGPKRLVGRCLPSTRACTSAESVARRFGKTKVFRAVGGRPGRPPPGPDYWASQTFMKVLLSYTVGANL